VLGDLSDAFPRREGLAYSGDGDRCQQTARLILAGAVVYCSAMVFIAYRSAPVFDRMVHVIALANWMIALTMLAAGLVLGFWLLWRAGIPKDSGGRTEDNR
jgi:hypothetical protein